MSVSPRRNGRQTVSVISSRFVVQTIAGSSVRIFQYSGQNDSKTYRCPTRRGSVLVTPSASRKETPSGAKPLPFETETDS